MNKSLYQVGYKEIYCKSRNLKLICSYLLKGIILNLRLLT